MSKSNFLFMDECISNDLDIAALTGLLVPTDSYSVLRDRMCSLVKYIAESEEGAIPPPPPIELHARDLLSDLTGPDEELDQSRLRVFDEVVQIVNQYDLRVIRNAYSNWSDIKKVMNADSNLYSLNFTGILFSIQELLAETLIIPVMDGIPSCHESVTKGERLNPQLIQAFALSVRHTHHYRQYPGMAGSISIQNYENLAELLFADSRYNTLIQLVDLVSYLLHQLERRELGDVKSNSSFRQEVLEIAGRLNPGLICSSLQRMQIHT